MILNIKWHGHSLCTLPKGQTSELEPLTTIKECGHAITWCIADARCEELPSLGLSFASLPNYSKTDFRGLFGKMRNKS